MSNNITVVDAEFVKASQANDDGWWVTPLTDEHIGMYHAWDETGADTITKFPHKTYHQAEAILASYCYTYLDMKQNPLRLKSHTQLDYVMKYLNDGDEVIIGTKVITVQK